MGDISADERDHWRNVAAAATLLLYRWAAEGKQPRPEQLRALVEKYTEGMVQWPARKRGRAPNNPMKVLSEAQMAELDALLARVSASDKRPLDDLWREAVRMVERDRTDREPDEGVVTSKAEYLQKVARKARRTTDKNRPK